MATKKKEKTAEGRIQVKALNNLSGKYLLPYSKDDVFTLSANQAEELVLNKDAEIINEK